MQPVGGWMGTELLCFRA